jgi:hypothetical protein
MIVAFLLSTHVLAGCASTSKGPGEADSGSATAAPSASPSAVPEAVRSGDGSAARSVSAVLSLGAILAGVIGLKATGDAREAVASYDDSRPSALEASFRQQEVAWLVLLAAGGSALVINLVEGLSDDKPSSGATEGATKL